MTGQRPKRAAECELCGVCHRLSFHHLIGRKLHQKSAFRARYGREEMRTRGAWLRCGCHDFIHAHFDERALGTRLDRSEALKAEPVIARHLAWASRQKPTA